MKDKSEIDSVVGRRVNSNTDQVDRRVFQLLFEWDQCDKISSFFVAPVAVASVVASLLDHVSYFVSMSMYKEDCSLVTSYSDSGDFS